MSEAFVVLRQIGSFLDCHSGAVGAVAALFVAAFTLTLWLTTRRTLKHLEREFLATFRPRLKVRQMSLREADGDSWVQYVIANVGGSPATVTESNITPVFFTPQTATPGNPYNDRRAAIGTPTIGPGQAIFGEYGAENMLAGRISAEHDKTLHLVGYIVYVDGLDIPRRMGFDRVYDSSSRRFRHFEAVGDDYEYSD
jgi:hypothetical protein